ncbi:ECF transporter S component [Enterococcus sp. AZ072]|uniref:ECF transporter S component n=1 Tax=unclassified Enterococcus TaxID=2608891 RepID=UPI003D2A4161
MAKSSNKFTIRDICFIALITSACVVGRTAFQFIPNVQPITAIFILVSFNKGFSRSFVIVLLTIFTTNIYMGMGPWTLTQVFSYTVIIIVSCGFSQIPWFAQHQLPQLIFALFTGYLFGFLTACGDTIIYGIRAFWPYYVQGIYFDTLHGVGNLLFYALLRPFIPRLLLRFWPNQY